MVTIGDMLRSKGVKSVGACKVPERPSHPHKKAPPDLIKLGFAIAEEEEARIRREDPIGADIMDQVFEMAAAEERADKT
jgi:hypothetical protein